MNYRVGFGYDVHQLKDHEDFILGGIALNYIKGTIGHSDADVLIHAICDALLGATNLGDIGSHFPDDSEEFKNIDSKILLQRVTTLMKKNGYHIGNIDCTICLEKPKLAPYIEQITTNLSRIMDIEKNKVSVKATTSEKMGYIGREEGIAVYAVGLVYSDPT